MGTDFTALTTAPLAPLLERLYEEADAESPATSPAVTELSLEEGYRRDLYQLAGVAEHWHA